MATIQITTLPEHTGYTPTEVHVALDEGDQAEKLCRIRRGLIAEGAQVSPGGRLIQDNAEALKWIVTHATAAE